MGVCKLRSLSILNCHFKYLQYGPRLMRQCWIVFCYKHGIHLLSMNIVSSTQWTEHGISANNFSSFYSAAFLHPCSINYKGGRVRIIDGRLVAICFVLYELICSLKLMEVHPPLWQAFGWASWPSFYVWVFSNPVGVSIHTIATVLKCRK